jgi:hypothetical protein
MHVSALSVLPGPSALDVGAFGVGEIVWQINEEVELRDIRQVKGGHPLRIPSCE